MGHIQVSVIVATAGAAELLEAVLSAARAQARLNAGELIVAWNAAADDPSRPLPESVRALADEIVFEPRPGKSNALNAAVRVARGEICAFLDDDGMPQSGWLAALLAPFAENGGAIAGVGGRVRPVPAVPGPTWYEQLVRGRKCFFLGPSHDLGEQRRDYPPDRMSLSPIGANCAYRREVLLKFGYAPELGPNRQTGSRGGEDTLLALQARTLGHRLVYEPAALVLHPVIAERMTPKYVERAYYWQGVEKERLRRMLGIAPRNHTPLTVRSRIWRYTLLSAIGPLVPLRLRLAWKQRAARQRGILDEMLGRVGTSIAVVALLGLAGCSKPVEQAKPRRPIVSSSVIDALRAANVGGLGYTRATSPSLDRLVPAGVRSPKLDSPAPCAAAHAGLFTSSYPSVHGVWNEFAQLDSQHECKAVTPSAVCLAEVTGDPRARPELRLRSGPV